jgi:hypothetical protein
VRSSVANELCDFHYRRLKRGADLSLPPQRAARGKTCTHVGCRKPNFSKGYCSMHYSRLKVWGDPDKSLRFFWKDDAHKYLWHGAKERARKLGLEFNLPKEWVSIPDLCPVLGIPLFSNRGGRGRFTDNSPTIDRIDNNEGYVTGNAHIISYLANRIKTNATVEQLERVATYFKGLLLNEGIKQSFKDNLSAHLQ